MQVIALHLKVGEEDSAAYHLTLLKRIKMVCFPTFTHFQKVWTVTHCPFLVTILLFKRDSANVQTSTVWTETQYNVMQCKLQTCHKHHSTFVKVDLCQAKKANIQILIPSS